MSIFAVALARRGSTSKRSPQPACPSIDRIAPAGRFRPSFHSGPSVACRFRPLMSNIGRTQDRRSRIFAISPVISWHMNAAAKILASMRRTQLDWQIGDLQTVARQNGIDWRHQKSSHCVFIREDGRTLSVPAHRPIKPIYVRKFVELIDGA